MYVDVAGCKEICESSEHTKPFILCEYTHAMGNSPGDAEDYQKVIEQYDCFAGGFVWEWCDHAVFCGYAENGKAKYHYGGDFGEFPHDGNFCMDGLVYPDRTPHTGLLEFKNIIRPVRAVLNEDNSVTFVNKFAFTDLEDFAIGEYTIERNGIKIVSGSFEFESDVFKPELPEMNDGTYTLNITYIQKVDTALVKAGHILGFDQLFLQEGKSCFEVQTSGEAEIDFIVEDLDVIVIGENFRYVFDKRKGTFSEMIKDNRVLIEKPIEYNIWRAPIDNERNLKEEWYKAGYDRTVVRVYDVAVEKEGTQVVILSELSMTPVYLQRTLTIKAEYSVFGDGTVKVKLDCEKSEHLPMLPRFGLRMFLPKVVCKAEYLGYGPYESYIDKRRASRWSRFTTTTVDNHEDYIRPQENGSHWGCSEVAVTNSKGFGFTALSEKPFSFNISPFTQEELAEKKHNYELEESPYTIFCIDYAQNGIGSGSCGPRLIEKYAFDEENFVFEFVLRPSAIAE